MLSHHYGWTTEYILSRTQKEIYWRLKAIDKRIQADLIFQATLHDKKIKQSLNDEIKEVQLKGVDKQKKQALEEIRKRYG